MSVIQPNKPNFTKIELQTRLGNPIDNRQESDFSINQKIPNYARDFKGVILRNEPNPFYNCHGLTFASSRTMVGPESISDILHDDGYQEIKNSDALPGDVIIYYDEKGEISHSGILVTKLSDGENGYPWVVSKWGMLSEVCHLAYDIPTQYLPFSKLTYWRIIK